MRNYYVLNNGRLRRKDNTIYIENAEGEKKPLPIDDVESLYVFGEVDLNTRLLNLLTQKRICLHVFNYYGFYSGTYYPREYLHSGFLVVQQVNAYSDGTRRAVIAGELVAGAAHSLLRNLSYYDRRRSVGEAESDPPGSVGPVESGDDATGTDIAVDTALTLPRAESLEDEFLADDSDFESSDSGFSVADDSSEEVSGVPPLESLASLRATMEELVRAVPVALASQDINALRGIEGKLRERYYEAWGHILQDRSPVSGSSGSLTAFNRRVRRPPNNPVNALISFGNGMLYTVCLSEIYRTQLHPTISYLHEPGARRFSLALDLSEIFKPLIVDRTIFRLLNTGQMKPSHFERSLNHCYLTDSGKKLFLSALEERLATTIRHRRLKRSVSYRHLIRLECYKLIRHLTDVEAYRSFRAWW